MREKRLTRSLVVKGWAKNCASPVVSSRIIKPFLASSAFEQTARCFYDQFMTRAGPGCHR
jgi:hypothetical protein